jgi:hypothetical protein
VLTGSKRRRLENKTMPVIISASRLMNIGAKLGRQSPRSEFFIDE